LQERCLPRSSRLFHMSQQMSLYTTNKILKLLLGNNEFTIFGYMCVCVYIYIYICQICKLLKSICARFPDKSSHLILITVYELCVSVLCMIKKLSERLITPDKVIPSRGQWSRIKHSSVLFTILFLLKTEISILSSWQRLHIY
jgi:hypothetical protein